MFRFRIAACFLFLCLAISCNSQSNPEKPLGAKLTRRIKVMVRTKYGIPPNYAVALGKRTLSQFHGYDELPIVISYEGKSEMVHFLLSSKGTKLVQMESFNLVKDPIFHINVAGRPILGNPNAKVTAVNFDDLECPFCARLYQELFPSTFERYKNKVRFIYLDFPLARHPWAMHAAVDADCLAAQNGAAYWGYVGYLHTHVDEITGKTADLKSSFAKLDRIARQESAAHKLDNPKLSSCIAGQNEDTVKASMREARTLGVNSVPTLFVNGERIEGARPENQIWEVIDRALVAEGETPTPLPKPQQATPPAAKAGK